MAMLNNQMVGSDVSRKMNRHRHVHVGTDRSMNVDGYVHTYYAYVYIYIYTYILDTFGISTTFLYMNIHVNDMYTQPYTYAYTTTMMVI